MNVEGDAYGHTDREGKIVAGDTAPIVATFINAASVSG
jgi:hypothetical protein